MENNIGDGAAKLSKSQRRRKRKLLQKLESLNKGQLPCPIFYIISQSSIPVSPNTGLGTTTTIDQNRTESSTAATGAEESSMSKTEGFVEIFEGEKGSSTATTPVDVKSGHEREENMEIVNDMRSSSRKSSRDVKTSKGEEQTDNREMGSSVATNLNLEGTVQKEKKKSSRKEKPTSSEILDPRHLDVMETTIGEIGSGTTATENTTSKKKKRKEKPTSSGILDTRHLDVMETTIDGIGSGTTATDNTISTKNKKQNTKNKKQNTKNKKPASNEILDPQHLDDVEPTIGETDSGTTAIDNTSQKRKKQKLKSKNSASGDTVISHEDSRATKVLETTCDEIVSVKTATPDAKIVSKGDESTKVANGSGVDEIGSGTTAADNTTSKKKKKQKTKNKKPVSIGILDPQHLDDVEPTNGETDSGTTSQKRKKQKLKSKNSASGDMVISQEDLRTTEVLETTGDETVSVKTATPDAKIVSKGDESTKFANGSGIDEIGSGTTATDNTTLKKKKMQNTKNKKPASNEILDPHHLDDVKPTIGETASGTTATDNTTSPKKKKQKLKSTNSASGDMVISQADSLRTEVLETTISVKIATPDVKIVSKGDESIKVANGEVGSSTATNLNTNNAVEKKKKSKKKPTIGEILNPQYSQGMETVNGESGSGTTATDNTTSEKRKKPEIENKAINEITHVVRSPTLAKKLLVFDVNGLLADIVSPRPKDFIADKYIPKRAIFKRPFLDDFMRFCFERFHVAIWSSRTWQVLNPVVDFLLGDSRRKLLFVGDASCCTHSRTKTLENKHKCIVFKDLRKIWDDSSNWVKGTYNESNTLLLDDSPYKGLLNPKHTGVFPESYTYRNVNDDFLGPGGGLRTYLEGLAAADDLKTYVEQHPFGRRAIDENDPNWAFYSDVLNWQRRGNTGGRWGNKKRYKNTNFREVQKSKF